MKIPAFSLPFTTVVSGEPCQITADLFYMDGSPIILDTGSIISLSAVSYVNQWRYAPVIYKKFEWSLYYFSDVVTTAGDHYIKTTDIEYNPSKTYYTILYVKDSQTAIITIIAREYTDGEDGWDSWHVQRDLVYEPATPTYVWMDVNAEDESIGGIEIALGESGVMNRVIIDIGADETELLRGEYLYQISVDNKMGIAENQGIIMAEMGSNPASDNTFYIVTQPQDCSGNVGDSFSMSVEAVGIAMAYQWQYRTSTTWENGTMTGSNTDTMTEFITSERYGYQYRCKITNGFGDVLYSEPATLRKPPFEITSQPVDFDGVIGGTYTFIVVATGVDLLYQWQYKSSSTGKWANSGLASATSATFTGEITEGRMKVPYRCKITDENGDILYTDEVRIVVSA